MNKFSDASLTLLVNAIRTQTEAVLNFAIDFDGDAHEVNAVFIKDLAHDEEGDWTEILANTEAASSFLWAATTRASLLAAISAGDESDFDDVGDTLTELLENDAE